MIIELRRSLEIDQNDSTPFVPFTLLIGILSMRGLNRVEACKVGMLQRSRSLMRQKVMRMCTHIGFIDPGPIKETNRISGPSFV